MKTRVSTRWNSWWKLDHGTYQALNSSGKNRVDLITGDSLSALTLQHWDNYLSTLSHFMLMMLQMLQTTTVMSHVGKFVNTFSLQVAQVNTEKVSGLDHLFLARKLGFPPKKPLNMVHCTTQHGVCKVMHPSLSR